MEKKEKTDIRIPKSEFRNASCGLDFHWWFKNATPLHSHTYYEIIIICNGPVTQVCNGKKYIMEKNDIFILKPGDVHMFQASPTSSHLNISIIPNELKKLCNTIDTDLFENINQAAPLLVKISEVEFNYLIYLADQIKIEKNDDNNKQYSTPIKNIVYNLLNSFFNYFNLLSNGSTNLPSWLSEYIKNLNQPENLEKRISDLYEIAPYSQTMLNSYFKKYFGKTLVVYVRELRLEYAAKMLLHSSYTISMIANKISYTTSHFIHEFTAFYGMSPTSFRNNINRK